MIVPAVPADLTAIGEVIVAAKSGHAYDPAYVAAALPLLRVDAAYLAAHACWVFRDPDVVGFAALVVDDDDATLDHLWVRPDRQRGGVGRSMVATVLAAADAGGARIVRVMSDPPAEGFYRRIGAVRVGEKPSRIAGGPVFPVLELAVR